MIGLSLLNWAGFVALSWFVWFVLNLRRDLKEMAQVRAELEATKAEKSGDWRQLLTAALSDPRATGYQLYVEYPDGENMTISTGTCNVEEHAEGAN